MWAESWRALVFLDTCVILCTVLTTGAAQQRRLRAQVGHSVNMPCVVPVPTITQWGTVRLFLQKRVPSSNPKVAFSFSNGKDQPDHQDRDYKNRCRLFKDNLTLSLSPVSLSDEGEYDCNVFLLKGRGYELEYTGQILLTIWADYSKPQLSFFEDMGSPTAVCSSNGGYPRADIEWNISYDHYNIKNMTETWAEPDPQTQLYNVSAQLTLPLSERGSISCCVVAAGPALCSDTAGLPGSGFREHKGSFFLVCLSLMMSLTLYTMLGLGVGNGSQRTVLRTPEGALTETGPSGYRKHTDRAGHQRAQRL
ncbi:T-lymphocyte activation antigen CD80 [Leptodactylus fuscus]